MNDFNRENLNNDNSSVSEQHHNNVTSNGRYFDTNSAYEEPKMQNGYSYQSPTMFSQKKRENKNYSFRAVLAAVLVAAIVGAAGGAVVIAGAVRFGIFSVKQSEPPTTENKVTTINVDKTASNMVEAVAEKVTPSVVGIRTTTSVTNFFYGSTESTGEGSGIVYTSDGYIITNYHVISEAVESKSGKIEVFLSTDLSTAYPAKVIGYNISTDLAVIKIEKTGLTAIELGNSEEIKVGEFVVAIGNPGGLEYMSTVTYGIVSGLNRSISTDSSKESEVQYIQTDAAINPGNSGGALVNSEGKLIGVNSVKIVSESYEGMGFAIPVKSAVEICQNIIDRKDDPVPYVGISLSERYDASSLRYLGFPEGAVVLSVIDDSPADEAGIKRGDIITKFGDVDITDYNDFGEALRESRVGDKVKVRVYRSGSYYSTIITVASENSVK